MAHIVISGLPESVDVFKEACGISSEDEYENLLDEEGNLCSIYRLSAHTLGVTVEVNGQVVTTDKRKRRATSSDVLDDLRRNGLSIITYGVREFELRFRGAESYAAFKRRMELELQAMNIVIAWGFNVTIVAYDSGFSRVTV